MTSGLDPHAPEKQICLSVFKAQKTKIEERESLSRLNPRAYGTVHVKELLEGCRRCFDPRADC